MTDSMALQFGDAVTQMQAGGEHPDLNAVAASMGAEPNGDATDRAGFPARYWRFPDGSVAIIGEDGVRAM